MINDKSHTINYKIEEKLNVESLLQSFEWNEEIYSVHDTLDYHLEKMSKNSNLAIHECELLEMRFNKYRNEYEKHLAQVEFSLFFI